MNRLGHICLLLSLGTLTTRPTLDASEIGFIESFALATDRSEAIEELIPGTDEHFFYSCLYAEQMQRFDEVERLLKAWIKQHGETELVKQIRMREMLLQYDAHPEKTVDYLRRELGLHFNHQRDRTGDDPRLPTALDPKHISRETLLRRAMRQKKNTDGFTEHAFDWLVTQKLNALQRRHLLGRLTRPDHVGLVKLVVEDLKQKDSRGFGSLGIHSLLLRDQLDACREQIPDLLNKQKFVNVYLRKLAPNDDVDWQYNRAAALDYLERAWDFVRQLDPAHNSLKAHILFRRLVLDRSNGTYDKQRFMDYLQLPRRTNYINPRLAKTPEWRRYSADLNYNSQGATLLPPVGSDEPLVRSYLQHFFLKETSYKAYEPYISDEYLKSLFAETKITAGIGDATKWYGMLRPDEVQALKDRIDLEFVPTNPTVFHVADDVELRLHVKNVNKLIVKVFRINTENYYRSQGRAVNTDIELDGLVANHELTFEYDEPSERRVERSFSFPQLSDRGVYVIDFIGNGISSRAVVRKGALRYLVRTGAAGQVFTILDESNEQVQDATLWIGGREFAPNDNGTIVIPFSTKPGRYPLVISQDGFSALHQFQHEGESYKLKSAFYVDREALIRHREAPIVVRPRLFLNGTPIGLGSLENVSLRITSVDHDGTATTKEVSDFELHEDRESTHVIQVPARLHRLQIELHAEVQQLSTGKQLPLFAKKELAINAIDKTPRTEDLHFLSSGGGYVIEVLGRSGEARAKRPVRVQLQHRDFTRTVHATLQSDEQGQIALGQLTDIVWVRAAGPDGAEHEWRLPQDRVAHYRTLHGVAGETLRIPYAGKAANPDDVALLSFRRGTPVDNAFDNLQFHDGGLDLIDLPAGDYLLTLKRENRQIRVRMTDGKLQHRHALGDARLLEIRNTNPLHITSAEIDGQQLTVQLAGHSKYTRVHVLATRYQPAFSPYGEFVRVRDIEPTSYAVPATIAQYVAGRDIGDEYRYVLERKYADKFPGNMLQRPSLLLNPWAIRDTQTGHQTAAEGEAFAPSADAPSAGPGLDQEAEIQSTTTSDSHNLDFLADSSAVFVNLRPDSDGTVSVKLKELGQHLHIVAVDPISTSYRQVARKAQRLESNDLRLILALDAEKHYAQRKQISVLGTGEAFVIPDVTTAKFDYYDSLQRMQRLYLTLSGDEKLGMFEFVTRWPQLTEEEQREKYSEFACHELHYFLLRKDPDFFQTTVLPYLQNKKDKTYLDRWLLGESLNEYLTPWEYSRLNIAEQILLGERIKERRPAMRRHVRELFELVPRDVTRLNHLFGTAIRGRSLESGSEFGLGMATQSVSNEAASRRAEGRELADMAGARPQGQLRKSKVRDRLAEADDDELMFGDEAAGASFGGTTLEESLGRSDYRRLYQQVEKTKEWVENNYYQLPLEAQNAQLVRVNAFWNELANRDGHEGDPFFSQHWAEASNNFTEMMLALASIDLPFEAQEHKSEFEEAQLTLTAASPVVIFHQQIQEVETTPDRDETGILVRQNFFRQDDRYQVTGGVQRDKFVTDEFLVHTVYGCQAVITNPTSAQLKAQVLLQVPQGAIPVANSHYTRSITIDLAPYSSQAIEYHFYFPVAGNYTHFPVHVSDDAAILGYANPVTLRAVNQLSNLDTNSWAYVSQFGSDADVLTFLNENNVHDVQLDRIAFRMRNKTFFKAVTDLLRSRHAYDHVLWSYSLKHRDVLAANEFLAHAEPLVQRIGPSVSSRLLTTEPVNRRAYEHREYWPLVNARAHQLGRSRRILNDRFHMQYHALMRTLAYQRELRPQDLLAITYYMLLQDRISEAREYFHRIDPTALETTLQYDYMHAYLDCFNEQPEKAASIVAKYENYPVDRWRQRFEAIGALLLELQGKPTAVTDDNNRDQTQAQLAATEPQFDLSLDGTAVRIDHKNLDSVEVNYYLMDLELLFSRNPFVTEFAGQFSHIFPNEAKTVALNGSGSKTFELPKSLLGKNVLIEVTAAGSSKSVSYYSNSMLVELIEAYGQLRVSHRESGKGIPTVYIKVYAEMLDGSIQFYKDGYTDLRGKFDYSSLSTNQLDAVRRFSVLVLSEEHGAVVREAQPPKQ